MKIKEQEKIMEFLRKKRFTYMHETGLVKVRVITPPEDAQRNFCEIEVLDTKERGWVPFHKLDEVKP